MNTKSKITLLFVAITVLAACAIKVSAEPKHDPSAKNRKYEEKIAVCTRAIASCPNDVEAYCNRADAYGGLGKHQESISDSNAAIGIDPKSAWAYTIRAGAYCDLLQYQKSIEDSTKAIMLDPTYARAYFIRGAAYGSSEHLQESTTDCTHAIELDPSYAFCYANRGMNYEELGQYRLAFRDFDQAIRLAPKAASLYSCRGAAYENIGEHQNAIKDFTLAIGLDPENRYAHIQQARAKRKLSIRVTVERGFDSLTNGNYFQATVGFARALWILFDHITIAIMLPTMALSGLISFAVRRKSKLSGRITRYLLFRRSSLTIINGPPPEYQSQIVRTTPGTTFVNILLSSCWAATVMNWCLSHELWRGLIHTSPNIRTDLLLSLLLCLIFSIACSLPLFCILEALLYQRPVNFDLRRFVFAPGRMLISVCAFVGMLFVLLPAFGIFQCSPYSPEFAMLDELMRVSIALATIPASLAALAVALMLNAHVLFGDRATKLADDYTLLTSPTFGFAGLEGVSDTHLHDLVALALTVGDLEKGDLLSMLLMRRAER
jgi:Flp pilus assembly protein TadD